MSKLRWLVAGVAVGVIAVAFRDFDRDRWLSPALPGGDEEPGGTEPILGYDGMDQETLMDWLSEADLDDDTIDSIIRYEKANRDRQPVLDALNDLAPVTS